MNSEAKYNFFLIIISLIWVREKENELFLERKVDTQRAKDFLENVKLWKDRTEKIERKNDYI